MTHKCYLRYIYQDGIYAKENTLERYNPFIGTRAEQFWYAGYDGADFDNLHNAYRVKQIEQKNQEKLSRR